MYVHFLQDRYLVCKVLSACLQVNCLNLGKKNCVSQQYSMNLLQFFVFGRISVAVIKFCDQIQLGNERIYLSSKLQSIIEESKGRNCRQDPKGMNKQRPWRSAPSWFVACILTIARTICTGVALPNVSLTCGFQLLINKMQHIIANNHILQKHFFKLKVPLPK